MNISSSTIKSCSTASSSGSAFTNAFVDNDNNRNSANRISLNNQNNLFTGSSDDVMSKVHYRPVSTQEDIILRQRKSAAPVASSSASDDGFIDEQFLLHPCSTRNKIPYKAIGLAVFLFTLGTIMCVIGGLLLSGIYIDQKYNDRTWPVLCLGLIMFIPGFYHVRIAYYAWKRVPGYYYSDIPDWD